MKCGLVDIGCQIHRIVDPIWAFLFWGFWAVVVLVALGILYRVKQVFGWQGVLAALVATGGVIIAIFSFKAGRDSVTPVDPRPKKPDRPSAPVVPVDPKPAPDIWGQKLDKKKKRK